MGLGILPPPGVAPPKAPDVQDFTSSGTWTKPDGARLVFYEGIGAGTDGAGATGGTGGSYIAALFAADDLAASESVTVGARPGGATIFAGVTTSTASVGTVGNAFATANADGGHARGTTTPYPAQSSNYGAGAGGGSAGGTKRLGGSGGALSTANMLKAGNGGPGVDTSSPGTTADGIAPGGGGGGNSSGANGLGAPGAARITTYF